MVSEGAQLYRGSVCVPCHGSQGEGTAVGPALDDPDWINISHDYEEIVRIIEMGVPSPQEYPAPMPRMGGAHFTQDQLRAIGAYVFAWPRPAAERSCGAGSPPVEAGGAAPDPGG
jgi:mono/diheme cytochrome c family protein